MADARRRRAERDAAIGDEHALTRLLAERLRTGEITGERVETAALFGHQPSRSLLGLGLSEIDQAAVRAGLRPFKDCRLVGRQSGRTTFLVVAALLHTRRRPGGVRFYGGTRYYDRTLYKRAVILAQLLEIAVDAIRDPNNRSPRGVPDWGVEDHSLYERALPRPHLRTCPTGVRTRPRANIWSRVLFAPEDIPEGAWPTVLQAAEECVIAHRGTQWELEYLMRISLGGVRQGTKLDALYLTIWAVGEFYIYQATKEPLIRWALGAAR